MAVDSTSKEYNFQRSIKKLFLDFASAQAIPVYFDDLDDVPRNSSGAMYTKWLVITFNDRELADVARQEIAVQLFTRNDTESDELIKLSDKLTELFFDSATGIKPITLYDTDGETWTPVGGILPYLRRFTKIYFGKDDTKFRILPIDCKWGSK